MLVAQLSKFTRPLNNQLKSTVKFQHLTISRNVSIQCASKTLHVAKSPEKLTRKSIPELSLKLHPQSKQLYLKLNDAESRSTSSQDDSKFCSFCNAPRCKLLNPTSDNENNVQLAKKDTNRVTISLDRDAFCRTICKSTENESPVSTTENSDVPDPKSVESVKAEDTSEYCDICKAPKCKLEANEKSESVESVKVEDTSEYCELCKAPKCKLDEKEDSESVESGKNVEDTSEYCDVCKAPKCKLEENLSKNPNKTDDVDVRSENPNHTDLYCKYCDAPKCKFTDNSTSNKHGNETKGRNEADSLSKKRNRNSHASKRSDVANKQHKRSHDNTTDVTKSPHYCPACKLPECKYVTSKTQRTASASTASTSSLTRKDAENISEVSNSSDKITITVDTEEICGMICKGEETSRSDTSASTTSPSKKDKAHKSKHFNSNYNQDNSKI